MLPHSFISVNSLVSRLSPAVLPPCGGGVPLQALAQAIKEAKEQHPDMSVTRVVVHKETELAEGGEGGENWGEEEGRIEVRGRGED